MADLDYEGFWKETLVQLRNDLREEEFGGWFSILKYLRADDNSIVVGAPSAFHRDKIISRYQDVLKSTLKNISGKDITLVFEVGKAEPEKIKENVTLPGKKEEE
jgi:chromosomal replication initiator protein